MMLRLHNNNLLLALQTRKLLPSEHNLLHVQAGPRVARASAALYNEHYLCSVGFWIFSNKYLPGIRGAGCFDGVDPQLVSDVFQSLQSLLVGFVVASHDLRTTGGALA